MAKGQKHNPELMRQAVALAADGLSVREVSERLGLHYTTVYNWIKRPTSGPASMLGNTAEATGTERPLRAVPMTPPGQEAPDEPGSTRAADTPPQRPPEGRMAPAPPAPDALDFQQIEDYITGFYKLAGQLAQQTDPALGEAIRTHADEAGAAWAAWIRSEPKVAALLQRMMIGTPMGRVVGVHVSLVIGYVLARNAQRDLQQRIREQERTADDAAASVAA